MDISVVMNYLKDSLDPTIFLGIKCDHNFPENSFSKVSLVILGSEIILVR